MIRPLPVLLILIGGMASAGETTVRDTDSVIYLTKNTNRNQVHYGVNVDEHCRPLQQDPVYAYWRMLEKGPEETDKLMFWEQPGYGVRQPGAVTRDTDSGSLPLVIRGVPERSILLQTFTTPGGCGARALTDIAGQKAQLVRIDIEVSGWANVHRVELHGILAKSGEPVSEVAHQD